VWQISFLALLVAIWIHVTTPAQKWTSLLFSLIYGFIEFNFYMHTYDHHPSWDEIGIILLFVNVIHFVAIVPEYGYRWKLFASDGFTTAEQFLMNVLYMPILTGTFCSTLLVVC
jgi:hypothetical protein